MSKTIFFLADRGRILFLTRMKNKKKDIFRLIHTQYNTESIAKSYSMFEAVLGCQRVKVEKQTLPYFRTSFLF